MFLHYNYKITPYKSFNNAQGSGKGELIFGEGKSDHAYLIMMVWYESEKAGGNGQK